MKKARRQAGPSQFWNGRTSGRFLFLGPEAVVEALVLGGHVTQEFVRAEAFAIGVGEAVGFLHELRRAPEQVDVADAAAGVWRKAPGQDRADIGVARVGDDALLEAARHFDALAEEVALGQLLLQFRRALLHFDFDAFGNAGPYTRRLAVFAVLVIALAALPADTALFFHDPRQKRRARILLVVLLIELGVGLADLQRRIEAD